MRVDDVVAEMKPEHFTSGRVPSRTTVSDRLAGIGIKDDFIQALADICSQDVRGRERLMQQVEALGDGTPFPRPAVSSPRGTVEAIAAELVLVQKRSLDVSDRLTRAMERATELERERNSANHMVLLLLTMVDALQRDIAMLARERDRLQASAGVQSLDDVEARLLRSADQRTIAESELNWAKEERGRADLLAEEAADQVRALTEELERLRGQVQASEIDPIPEARPELLGDGLGSNSWDIDEALAKAERHLEDRADRLDRIAAEMDRDNLSDNPLTGTFAPDNRAPEPAGSAGSAGSAASPPFLEPAGEPAGGSALQEALRNLAFASISSGPATFVEAITDLREKGSDGAADGIIGIVGREAAPAVIPALVTSLLSEGREGDCMRLLAAVGEQREPLALVLEALHRHGLTDAAFEVLDAVGRGRPPAMVGPVLMDLDRAGRARVIAAAGTGRRSDELRLLKEELDKAGWTSEGDVLHDEYLYRRRRDSTPTADASVLIGNSGAAVSSSREQSPPPPAYGLPLSTRVRATGGRPRGNRSGNHLRVHEVCESNIQIHLIARILNFPFDYTTSLVMDLLHDNALRVVTVSD
ncbi:hypothetical protein [Streptomyces sp. NPDC059566]|uniref:hypothetical protein n=1 Tax=Streptomyces sp. NPDC059566 TaxID=3346866 RepID=UPI0036A92064